MTKSLRPALFLDRDGVINEVGHLHCPDECRLVDGIANLIRTANQLGFVTCVITDQTGIDRGYYTETDCHVLIGHIEDKPNQQGAHIDAVYFSPFHPEHGLGHYRQQTDCRKPGPGMLLRAAAEHGIDLSQSLLVGDRYTDLQAGQAAGVQQLYLFGTTEVCPCHEGLSYTTVNHLLLVEKGLRARLASTLSTAWMAVVKCLTDRLLPGSLFYDCSIRL